jgi:hypothetical protein
LTLEQDVAFITNEATMNQVRAKHEIDFKYGSPLEGRRTTSSLSVGGKKPFADRSGLF